MEADEVAISLYLKSYPGQFVSAAEICRRAGTKRRFRKQPDWALPILKRMVDAGLLESDSTGHYRLAPTQDRERKKRRWVSRPADNDQVCGVVSMVKADPISTTGSRGGQRRTSSSPTALTV